MKISSNPPSLPRGCSPTAAWAGVADRVVTRLTSSARMATHDQNDSGADQQPGGTGRRDHAACPDRAYPCPETAADADQREEPLALFLRVEIGGECPELRDRHEVEDADPQEIHDSDMQAGADREHEQHEVRREEKRHPSHQPHPVHAGRERSIRRHEEQEEHRLPGRRVALDLGSALREDEHLSRRLEHVIGGQEQEHQQRHQQRAGGLRPVHVRDRRQHPLDRCLRLGRWGHEVPRQGKTPAGVKAAETVRKSGRAAGGRPMSPRAGMPITRYRDQ